MAVIGHSQRQGVVVVLFLRHARTGEWMLPGGHYDSTVDASRDHTATREFVEEAQGVPSGRSAAAGNQLLQRATDAHRWHGPYGSHQSHMGFVLVNGGLVLPSMDALEAAFTPNHECTEATLVPLENVDGNSKSVVAADGRMLRLRNHVGYRRVQAMRTMKPTGQSMGADGASGTGGIDVPVGSSRPAPNEEITGDASAAGDTVEAAGDTVEAERGRRALDGPDEVAQREQRRVRFAHPPDAQRALQDVRAQRTEYAAAGQRLRTARLAPTGKRASTDLVWERSRGFHGLNFMGGRRRAYDIQSWAELDGSHCWTQDKKVDGPGGEDLERPAEREVFRQDSLGRYDWAHMSWDCFSWSPALSLPPGGSGFGDMGDKPLGPYRGPPPAHDGHDWLSPTLKQRVDCSTRMKDLGIELAYDIHRRGGSVTIESAPDCRDPEAAWHYTKGGYSTATQWPLWEDPAVKEYIKDTGSTLVTRPMRAFGSPYQAYRTLCFNPAAYAHAQAWRNADVTSPSPGVNMSGIDAAGRAHGERAGEYTPRMCEMLYGVHRDAVAARQLRGDAQRRRDRADMPPPPPPAPPPPPPVPPPRPPPQSPSPSRRIASAPIGAVANGGDAPRPTAGGNVASIVFLVVVLAGKAMVGLMPGGAVAAAQLHTPFTAAGRKAALASAAGMLAQHYSMSEVQAPLLMAGAYPKRTPVEYVVAALADEKVQGIVTDLAHVTEHLAVAAMREHIALAISSVQRLVGDAAAEAVPLPPGCVLGHALPVAVAVEPLPSKDGTRLFETRAQQDAEHHDLARRALDAEVRRQSAAGDVDMAQYLHEVHKEMAGAPLNEVPPAVAGVSAKTEEWMMYEPFYVKSPLASQPLPRVQPQRGATRTFTSIQELHTPGFLDELAKWFAEALAWMVAVHRGDDSPPQRPGCFVASNTEAFVPDAQGIVWDVRRHREGIIAPLDFTVKQETEWNVEWLREQWRDYCDEEAVCHACDGADHKLELELQYCFSPHLLSLADGYQVCYDDLAELRERGYYAWFTTFAFCPCRFNGQGTRAKGPGFRRIASGSCPYEPILDSDGKFAYSINAESRRLRAPQGDCGAKRSWRKAFFAVVFLLLLRKVIRVWPDLDKARRRFRKERKPRVKHAMHDTMVMRAIGDRLGLGVYYFSDDFRSFFYQIRLAVHCLWYSGIYMYDPGTGLGVFIVELVLAMGYTPSSNIAQMICDAILYIFDNLMAAEEAAAETVEQGLSAVMAARAARHGHRSVEHARPWTSRGYTDDCLLILLGATRFVRGVMVWRRLLRTARIAGARSAKRQGGTSVLFLGVTLLATAMIANVPEHKLLSALLKLAALLAGQMSKENAGRLFGLLVHLSFISATGRASTAGMWWCLRACRSDPVRLTASEATKAAAWQLRLRTSHAAPMDLAMRRRRRGHAPPHTAVTVTGQSDAYSTHREMRAPSEEVHAGAGGYVVERVWRVPFYGSLLRAPISGLELLAFLLHTIVNRTVAEYADFVTHFVDNVNAFLALTSESATAPFMQWLYDRIRMDPAFVDVAHKLRVGQRWGVWLLLADAASRGYATVVDTVRARTGISMVWVQPDPLALRAVAQAEDAYARIEIAQTPAPDLPQPSVPHDPRPSDHSQQPRRRAHRAKRGSGHNVLLMLLAMVSGGLALPAHRSSRLSPTVHLAARSSGSVRAPRASMAATAAAAAVVGIVGIGLGAAGRAPREGSARGLERRPRRQPSAARIVRRESGQQGMPGPSRSDAVHGLAYDGSSFDLQPQNPEYLHGLLATVDDMVDAGVNENTSKGEESAWHKYYLPYCRLMRTATWREYEARRRPRHEATFLCGFAMQVWRWMRPRSKRDKAPRVDSVRNVIGHVRRRHERRGFELVSNKAIAHLMRGITRRRIAEYGVALPVRAEPFTAAENVALKRVPAATLVGGQRRSPHFWANWRLVDTYGDQAGPRKAEIVGYDDIHYKRADVQFVIAGEVTPDPTNAQLRSMVSGRDSVTVMVNISKADADGTKFGPSLVTLLYNTANPMSFAAAMLAYELEYPCRGAMRRSAPLFTTDGTQRWSGKLVDATLTAVMNATLTPAQRKGKTFHSKRVWVACALGYLDSSDAEIQAFVRWSSADSLKLYRRIGHAYQAKRRDLMATADVSLYNATHRPEIGGGDGTLADGDTGEAQLADDFDAAQAA